MEASSILALKALQAREAAANATPPDPKLVMECIRDQGRYIEAFGEIVTCYRCGKKTQFLTQCGWCGAP